VTADIPTPAPAADPYRPDAPQARSRFGATALGFAIASACFPLLVFISDWARPRPGQGAIGVSDLVAILGILAQVFVMPITGVVGLVLAILAIRRRGRDRGRGIIALLILGAGLLLVLAEFAVYRW
jgi:hypothetical protein